MLLDGQIITNGTEIIGYLDKKMQEVKANNEMTTGIIIGSRARKFLSEAAQKIMGQPVKEEMTVNRFRGAILIEDGDNIDRVEVVHAKAPTMPVTDNVLSRGLKRLGQ